MGNLCMGCKRYNA